MFSNIVYTEKQIKDGFWYWDRTNNFPPDSVTAPEEYNGQSRLNIACTQRLNMSATEQKKLVETWVDFLPNCTSVEMLWFTTHTTQRLFDSACKLENLVGLNVKWSNIKSLESISKLKNLRYLRIGSSSQIQSILPLAKMVNLEVLKVENFKRITDYSPLVALKDNLRFLSIEGGMYTRQKIDSFEPFSELKNLIYFSAITLSSDDKRIDPILKLKNLITLNWCFKLTTKDVQRLKDELPVLRHFP